MLWHRTAVTALALVALAVGGRLAAADPKAEPPAKGHDRLQAMAAKLGLSDQQQADIRKVHADFDPKLADVEHQLSTLHHEEHQATSKVLTDDQRAKVPALLKAVRDKELEKIADKLGLSADQKKKLEEVREENEKKFHDVAAKGESGREQFHALRHEFHAAIGKELTDDQRAKLPGVLREEYHEWRDPAARREHMKAIADELNLSTEQKEQMKKIRDEYDPKAEKLAAQLKQAREDEHAAVDKVLTDAQRTKVQELRKEREAVDKKPG